MQIVFLLYNARGEKFWGKLKKCVKKNEKIERNSPPPRMFANPVYVHVRAEANALEGFPFSSRYINYL